ncbi:LysE family translocator [Kordia zhangzhouensis]|uniref:LysE family translocator n=1 Tax=Kordia zhangzhouensis TaxID=1620405 RepID=UPI0006297072|nr:LysE family transporter [Kordia zhangzhouensis]
MFDGIAYAALYGFILAFAIGPVFFIIIETSITKGFRSAIAFDLGAIFADILFIIFAYYSTSQILDKIKDDPNLIIFGGLILVAFGVISYVRTSRSFRKIVREHYNVDTKKNLLGLFIKGFLLNFINFGVLAGWIGVIIMANALTSSSQGVILFLTTVLVSMFVTDIAKILLAKKLKNKMTPRFIFKTKKWVSILIIIFGSIMILQGVFPKGKDKIKEKIESYL